MMKYVFGPVPSRRLGRSLGISPIPFKTCNFSCIYCQLGRTNNFTNERKEFYPVEDIAQEVEEALNQGFNLDFITIVGDGEPTLYKSLGTLILSIKELTSIPIAVITNGALLYQEKVREDLLDADVVLPTLDVYNEKLFRIINRPHKELKFEKIIEGFRKFREEFKKQIWIEVMLVREKNDDKETLEKIRDIIVSLHFDKTFINVPIRPPAEKWVQIPTIKHLNQAKKILNAESISNYEEVQIDNVDTSANPEKVIIEISQRHPLREEQIYTLLKDYSKEEVRTILKKMEKKNELHLVIYNKKRFWEIPSKNKKRESRT